MRDVRIFAAASLAWLSLSSYLGWWLLPRLNVSPRWTPLLVVAIPLVLSFADVILYAFGGNESTFSWTLLKARARNPLVVLSTCYTFGVFVGHVFFPRFAAVSPPFDEVIARMTIVLSPTFYSLTVIAFSGNATEAHIRGMEKAGGEWTLFVLANVAFLIGQFGGKYALCQHVAPGA